MPMRADVGIGLYGVEKPLGGMLQSAVKIEVLSAAGSCTRTRRKRVETFTPEEMGRSRVGHGVCWGSALDAT